MILIRSMISFVLTALHFLRGIDLDIDLCVCRIYYMF